MPDHLEAAGHVIEGLGHVFADAPQRAAAARARRTGAMHHLLARQVLGQWPAGGLLRLGHAFDDGGRLGRGGRQLLGLVGFQGLDRQLELFGLARQLLRGPAELGAAIARQLELQPDDLGSCRRRIADHLGDDPLQRGDVVR